MITRIFTPTLPTNTTTTWVQEAFEALVFILAMADPALIQQLQMIQVLNYVDAAAGALVVYNQVLTFSQEVDHIWVCLFSWLATSQFTRKKMNTEESTVELYDCFIPYCPLLWISIHNRRRGSYVWQHLKLRLGSSELCRVVLILVIFRSEAIYINWTYSGYLNVILAGTWLENIFIVSMQAILVIRVYALFNRSKKVLIFLATLYALQATAILVLTALSINNRALHEYVSFVSPAIGSVAQFFGTTASANASINLGSTYMPLVFDTIVLVFALWAFVKHALEAKTLHGGWSINVLLRTLMADHLVYFVCFQIWAALTIASNYTSDGSTALYLLLNVLTALVVVVGPRMVISLRVIENKTRGEGGTLEGEVSTIRFGVREPPTQSESVVEEGGGFGAADENVRTD